MLPGYARIVSPDLADNHGEVEHCSEDGPSCSDENQERLLRLTPPSPPSRVSPAPNASPAAPGTPPVCHPPPGAAPMGPGRWTGRAFEMTGASPSPFSTLPRTAALPGHAVRVKVTGTTGRASVSPTRYVCEMLQLSCTQRRPAGRAVVPGVRPESGGAAPASGERNRLAAWPSRRPAASWAVGDAPASPRGRRRTWGGRNGSRISTTYFAGDTLGARRESPNPGRELPWSCAAEITGHTSVRQDREEQA